MNRSFIVGVGRTDVLARKGSQAVISSFESLLSSKRTQKGAPEFSAKRRLLSLPYLDSYILDGGDFCLSFT